MPSTDAASPFAAAPARQSLWPLSLTFGHWYEWAVLLAAALVLLPLGQIHFLLFHVTAEVFSSVVGILVFVVAASTYRFSRNDFLLVIGAGYFWVAILDLVHMVAYKGMNILPGDSANPATQYWIAARILEAATLVAAPFFLRRHVRPLVVFAVFAAVALVAEETIRLGVFPDAYRDGVGLTPFKIVAEYAVIVAMMAAGGLTWRARARLPHGLFSMMSLSIGVTILAELHFTAYIGVYDLANQMGHVLKIVSFWFIFLATVRITLLDPFSAMSQDANTLHAIPDPTLVVSRDGDLLYANRAARRDLGPACNLSRGGRPFDAKGAFLGSSEVARTIAAGEALPPGTVIRLGDAFYDASATPVRGREQGDGSVVVLRDITSRVVAEQQKESALRALERSTAELEQYAYVASHDLQEPMRQVASYVGLLEHRYAGQLDKDADEYIQYAVEGVHRLQSIVQDLLLYSRVAHGPLALRPTDIRPALNDALAGAAGLIAQVGATIQTPETMPPVMADGPQITEVFRHLVDNALIYRHPGRRPEVTITARSEGAMVAFAVRDNGVGIDPEFHQRVFELFKRLQTREHHDGNGVGLPVVRQIVERHGGTVSIQSATNEGTEITFTLRAA